MIRIWGVFLLSAHNFPLIFSYLSHFIIDLRVNMWYNIGWRFVFTKRVRVFSLTSYTLHLKGAGYYVK